MSWKGNDGYGGGNDGWGQGNSSAYGGGQGNSNAYGGGQGNSNAYGGGQGNSNAYGGGQGNSSAYGGGGYGGGGGGGGAVRVAPPSHRGGYGQGGGNAGAGPGPAPRIMPTGGPPPINVTGCQNPTVSNIIKGTFYPNGTNHDKPVYKKDGSGQVSVLIYYWDERDGPTFSGWWFGPKIGGDQVWAYNGNKASPVPPPAGWKVPWDGPVDASLQLKAGPPAGGGGGGGGGGGAPNMQSMEDRKRLEAEQRKRDEERRQQQEEALRKKKEKEEEDRQRAEEAAKRREEEEVRRKEQAAALAVRKVIQRVRIATPETYDNLRNELEEAQAEHLEAMGSQAEKVSQEAEKALQQAQQRIDEINQKREDDERRAQEEEKRRREEAETVERLMKELQEEVDSADAKVAEAQEAAKAIGEDAEAQAPDAMVATATATEKVVQAAREVLDATSKSLSDKKHEMGDNEASRKVRKDVNDLYDRLSSGKRTLGKLADSVATVLEKASRKAAALKKLQEKEAEFEKHDLDKDGKLSSKEVVKFSKDEYDFDLPEETLAKILRILEPIEFAKFQRMRGMVAIAKSEVKARALRAEEEEKRRVIEERRTAMQKVIDELAASMETAEACITKAETEARPVTRGTDLPAEELRAVAEKIETHTKEGQSELAQLLERLQKADDDCAADEDLSRFVKRDLPWLRQRVEKLEGRVEKAESASKTASEQAVKKAYSEVEALRTKVVLAVRTKMATDEKSGEDFFQAAIQGGSEAGVLCEAIAKDKFPTFLEGLGGDLGIVDGQADKLFDHIVGEEGELNKDLFLELIKLYYKCVKSTVLTETISIKSKTMRRLEVGEVLECLEGPTKEEGANVQRVRCQAVSDDVAGWVTIAGNQGTPFLEPGGNLYSVVKETVLTDSLSVQDAKTIRRVTKGEIIEVLEFAKKDATVGVKRIRGKAKQDGATGWLTISGNQGTNFLEPC